MGRSAKCTAGQTTGSDLLTVDFCNVLGKRSQGGGGPYGLHSGWIKEDKAEFAGIIGG